MNSTKHLTKGSIPDASCRITPPLWTTSCLHSQQCELSTQLVRRLRPLLHGKLRMHATFTSKLPLSSTFTSASVFIAGFIADLQDGCMQPICVPFSTSCHVLPGCQTVPAGSGQCSLWSHLRTEYIALCKTLESRMVHKKSKFYQIQSFSQETWKIGLEQHLQVPLPVWVCEVAILWARQQVALWMILVAHGPQESCKAAQPGGDQPFLPPVQGLSTLTQQNGE